MFINSAKLSTTEYVTLSLLIAAKCAFAQAIFAFSTPRSSAASLLPFVSAMK